MSSKRILYLFTRTLLHVGAGASVGAIDQPIIRERHTGFPVIPGTALKGVLADEEPFLKKSGSGKWERTDVGREIFGDERTDGENTRAGSVSFGEAKLLAFPVRSGRGCFAWLTCPIILKRWAREARLSLSLQPDQEPKNNEAYFDKATLGDKAIFEDYIYVWKGEFPSNGQTGAWLTQLGKVLTDAVWKDSCSKHLALVNDEALAHFVRAASEVSQHVRIDDETGTQFHGALFNQENVPAEALFFAPLVELRPGALAKITPPAVIQIGGDATTGLGYCSAEMKEVGE
ncbi:MAG: type III-B CRISPR module RAMP protein Cmr4 [Verrucomicrobia bacterium]|nr:type III-B CRISPR module RAMP protein Cmr4 [Verrucomicrobiota bacterium]